MQQLVSENSIQNKSRTVVISESVVVLNEVAVMCVAVRRPLFEFDTLRPSFMGIVFGSGILLDLVLFANRIIAEPKS